MAQGTQSLRKETSGPQFSTVLHHVLSPPPGIPEAFVGRGKGPSSQTWSGSSSFPAGALPAFLPPSGPGGSLVPRESPPTPPGYCL